jgi:hypothetical protein
MMPSLTVDKCHLCFARAIVVQLQDSKIFQLIYIFVRNLIRLSYHWSCFRFANQIKVRCLLVWRLVI